MKRGCLKRVVLLSAAIMMGLFWSGQALAVEPVSIVHTVQSYIDDGATTTVTLDLEVKNNSAANMNNVVITLLPMPKDHLYTGPEGPQALSIGSLAMGEVVNADYTLTGIIIFPQDMIGTLPIFWDVRYTDDMDQESGAMIVSDGNNIGGLQ